MEDRYPIDTEAKLLLDSATRELRGKILQKAIQIASWSGVPQVYPVHIEQAKIAVETERPLQFVAEFLKGSGLTVLGFFANELLQTLSAGGKTISINSVLFGFVGLLLVVLSYSGWIPRFLYSLRLTRGKVPQPQIDFMGILPKSAPTPLPENVLRDEATDFDDNNPLDEQQPPSQKRNS